jgi:hypothetical protein
MILKSTFDSDPVKGFNSLEDAIKYYEPIKLPLPEYSHQLPEFPIWTNRNRKIQGETINLYSLTCTCADYSERSLQHNERDVRKVCRHLYLGFIRHRERILDELSKLLMDQQLKYGVEQLYKYDDFTFLGTQAKSYWIKIYTLQNESWRHYSYNREEKRFNFNQNPPQKIRELPVLYDIK